MQCEAKSSNNAFHFNVFIIFYIKSHDINLFGSSYYFSLGNFFYDRDQRERDRGRYYFSLGNFFYDRDQRERETDGDRERGVSKSIYVIPLDKKMKG